MIATNHCCIDGHAIGIALSYDVSHYFHVQFGFTIWDVPLREYGFQVGLCVGRHVLIGLALLGGLGI